MAQAQEAIHLYGDQDFLDYTPAAAVSAGQVVAMDGASSSGTTRLVGVATRNIAAGEKAALAVSGVYKFKKDSTVHTRGTVLQWDDSANNAVASGGTFGLGVCVEDAASGDEFVIGRLNHVRPS